jgi:fibronectin type 3 domain-containing protein
MSDERASVFESTQIGIETHPGSPVTARNRLLATSIKLQTVNPINMIGATGAKFNQTAARQKRSSTADIDGYQSYNDLAWLLASALCKEVITVPGGTLPRLYTFRPNSYGPDLHRIFTVEQGSSVEAEKITYGVVQSLEMRWTPQECSVSGSLFGQGLEEDQTLTGSVVDVPIIPIDPDTVKIEVGDSLASLIKLTRATEASLSIGDRYAAVTTVDAEEESFSTHVERAPALSLSLQVQHNSVAQAIMNNLRNKETRYIRITATGPEIETGWNYYMQITAGFKYREPNRGDAQDSFASTFELVPIKTSEVGSSIEILIQTGMGQLDVVLTPGMPTVLIASPGNGIVQLNWNAAGNVSGYNVKRSLSPGGPYTTLATNHGVENYTDATVTNGVTYYYIVTGYSGGRESDPSNEVETRPNTIPAVPSGVIATPGDTQIVVNWNSAARAESYIVKRGTSPGGPYTTIATITGLTYTDTGRTNGTPYYYVVSASNTIGASANSAEVTATPAAGLGAVTNLQLVNNFSQPGFTWDALPGASGYRLKRATASGGPYTTIKQGIAGPVVYDDTGDADYGATPGGTFFYVVVGYNGAEGPNSNEVEWTTAGPEPPDDLDAVAITEGIYRYADLSWPAAAQAESYAVYRSLVSGGPYTLVQAGITDLFYRDTAGYSLEYNTTYYYAVKSFSGVYSGNYSPEATITTAP